MARVKDTSFLEWHGQQWRVQLRVPDRLRAIVGTSKLVIPLKTDSLAIANRDKHRHVHALKQRLAEAERQLTKILQKRLGVAERELAETKKPRGVSDPLIAEGLRWREDLAAPRHVEPGDFTDAEAALDARYEELLRREGEGRADLLMSIAFGKATPLSAMVEEWLGDAAMRPRQRLDYRRAVAKLEAWLETKSLPQTIEAITKRVASDYRAEAFVRAGVHPRTANKDLSALSGLWKHAERRAVVEANPWRGQFLPEAKAGPTKGAHKRPFTDAELRELLAAEHAAPFLRDAIVMLALSGMRTEELARLKVGEVRDLNGPIPYVALRGTKTAAARRDVPLHSDALAIVRRRIKCKAADAYLFDELPTPPADSAMERGQPLTKAFGRLRKRLGIDEREEGSRQANIDLHSLRRWFISKARDAINTGAKGFTLYTVAEVVGHAKGDLGLSMTSRYAGREGMDAKRACVEAVKLP